MRLLVKGRKDGKIWGKELIFFIINKPLWVLFDLRNAHVFFINIKLNFKKFLLAATFPEVFHMEY